LPEHRQYNCTIDLQEKIQPPFDPIFNLSQNKLLALKDYIEENIAKNFIQYSKSLVGTLILFVKKKDKFLQMCIGYCRLNKVTVNNRCPLSLIS